VRFLACLRDRALNSGGKNSAERFGISRVPSGETRPEISLGGRNGGDRQEAVKRARGSLPREVGRKGKKCLRISFGIADVVRRSALEL